MIPKYADNLKSLRGLKFDWARNDGNQDHVYSNQAFTHKLNEFGIAHEAEEYNGVWGSGKLGGGWAYIHGGVAVFSEASGIYRATARPAASETIRGVNCA